MRTKVLVAILIIALLVVYYIQGTDYLKLTEERDQLASQIEDSQTVLAKLPRPATDLEQRLEEANNSLRAEENAFPPDVFHNIVVQNILQMAEDYKVKAIPLSTQEWVTEEHGMHKYSVFRLSIAADGDFSQMVSFINELENGEYPSLVIESLSVERDVNASGTTKPVSATVNLAIYTQPKSID